MSPKPLRAVHSSSEGVGVTEALGSQNTGGELFAFFMARVSSYLSLLFSGAIFFFTFW